MKIDYSKLPKHIRKGMFRWIEFGNLPGRWMCQLLMNNLTMTWGLADATNREHIGDIIDFIYNEAPDPCWRSKARMDNWAVQGGARGRGLKLVHLHIPDKYFEPEGRRPE